MKFMVGGNHGRRQSCCLSGLSLQPIDSDLNINAIFVENCEQVVSTVNFVLGHISCSSCCEVGS